MNMTSHSFANAPRLVANKSGITRVTVGRDAAAQRSPRLARGKPSPFTAYSPPAPATTDEMIERIEHLYSLRVLERMGDFPTTCCAAAPDGWPSCIANIDPPVHARHNLSMVARI